jgi:hypothetical protein
VAGGWAPFQVALDCEILRVHIGDFSSTDK